MRVHLPKSLHGWREFFGEVGTVAGVLIALRRTGGLWLRGREPRTTANASNGRLSTHSKVKAPA